MPPSFEEQITHLLSLNYQLTSLQQCVKKDSYTPQGHWRIVLHRPPSLIFSYGWGDTWEAALEASLAEYRKQAQAAQAPAPWLSISDFNL